jgi:hypothetical protein
MVIYLWLAALLLFSIAWAEVCVCVCVCVCVREFVFGSVASGSLGRPDSNPFTAFVSDKVENSCQICALSIGWGYNAFLHSVKYGHDSLLYDRFVHKVCPIAIRVQAGDKVFALFSPTVLALADKSSNGANSSVFDSDECPTGTVILSNDFHQRLDKLSHPERQIVLMHLFRSPIAIKSTVDFGLKSTVDFGLKSTDRSYLKSTDGLDVLYHAALYAHAKCLPEFSTSGLIIKCEVGKGYGVFLSAEKPVKLHLGIAGKVIQPKDFNKLSKVHWGRVIHTCQCSAGVKCSHLMVFVDSACLTSHINSSLDSSNLQTINVPIESPNSNPDDVIECYRDKSGRLVVTECAVFFSPLPFDHMSICSLVHSLVRVGGVLFPFHFFPFPCGSSFTVLCSCGGGR